MNRTFKTLEYVNSTESRSLRPESSVHRQSVDSTQWVEAPHRQPVQTQFSPSTEAPAGPPEPSSCVLRKTD